MVNLVSIAVFDVLVVGLTVYCTGRIAFESKKSAINGGLSFILFWDGVWFQIIHVK